MARNHLETVMGAVVLLVAGLFLAFAWQVADLQAVQGYTVEAAFRKVGGLQTGSDVRISGIKVGTVSSQSLDPDTYSAVVTMSIRPNIQLPVDTLVSIASDGLMGGQYVRLEPAGAGGTLVEPGGRLTSTREPRSLEDTVSELIYLVTGTGGQP